jgi:hypothetical protein
MTTTAFAACLRATADCAHEMMSNAAYILDELPSLKVPQSQRIRIESVCNQLISTKHDVVHELHEIDEMENHGSIAAALPRIQSIHAWISEDMDTVHCLVESLMQEFDDDGVSLAALLVTESAANILVRYTAMLDKLESIQVSETPEPD